MSSDIFAGNQNNVAKSISKMWVGSQNNIAMPVKGVYIGDQNNQAKKVWPNSILPTSYQQLEWIRFLSGQSHSGINTYIESVLYPRIVMSVSFPDINVSNGYLFGCMRYGSEEYTSDGTYRYEVRYLMQAGINNKLFVLSNDVFRDTYESSNYVDKYQNDLSFFESSEIEPILSNTIYTLDYNLISNNMSSYYLYNTEGYYSIESNNLLVTHTDMSAPIASARYAVHENYIRLFSGNPYIYNSQVKTYPTRLTYKSYSESPYLLYYSGPSYSNIRNIVPYPMTFYSCQIYDKTNSLLRNYLPCYRKSDNFVGLYDMISKTFSSIGLTKDSTYILPGPTV